MSERARWPRRRSPAPWNDPEPIRSEIFGPDRFAQHAVSLADSHMTVARVSPAMSIVQRLDDNDEVLLDAYRSVVDDLQHKRVITPAAEWLVDNYHMVERHVRQIREDLPPKYFRQLPKLGGGFLAGHPRILGIVWAYVAHTDSLFDPDLLGTYVRAYESRRALTLGELWATAITLRLLLIENLRRLAELVITAGLERQRADLMADRLLGLHGGRRERLEELLGSMPAEPTRPFAVQLMRRLRGQDQMAATTWLNERLDARGVDAETAVEDEHHAQAAATVTMRNIFTSLRLISDVNWEEWLEGVSLIEFELRGDAGYAAQDFPTRNLYRSAIEKLARGARCDEIDVTRAALHYARDGSDIVSRDVGFWLLDDGRRSFTRAIGFRPTLGQRLVAAGRRVGLAGYLGAAIIGVVGLLAVTLWLVSRLAGGLSPLALAIIGASALIPLSDFTLGTVNYWSARLFHAAPLPALALRDGVPDEFRTLVVIPTLLGTEPTADQLVELLEVHYLANSFGEIYFALVTDWTDSPTEHRDGDEALVERATEGITQLNERYGPRFLLLHRARRFNPTEGVWMGWERKRGKLQELNRLLRGATDTSFTTIVGRLPSQVRYVLTLDSDTRLPREAARRLVGKISHPLNQPRLDPGTGRVARGYGILQPRVTPSLPMSEGSSYFQRVYSTPPGLDPYAFVVSDVYQDLFAEGSFAGKGIYDVDTVEATIDGHIPDNAVLSHDLLEGSYARSGLVTDVEVVEQYPMSYEVAASREHRWARGDWLLLPWLTFRRHGISHLGRWKMLDNLRRALSPISLVVGLLATLVLLPPAAAVVWITILVVTFFLPPLLPLVTRLAHWRRGVTARSQLQGFLEDTGRALVQGILNLTFLGHRAWLMADATVRSWWRLFVSRRHRLEWTTAAQAAAGANDSVDHYVRLFRGGFVPPLLALAAGASQGWANVAVAAPFAALWFAAPFVAHRVSQPYDTAEVTASAAELDALRQVARRTWHFFDTFVTAEDHYLPPDNFQEDPQPVVAHRTSPTNIGLYLLSTVSARDFGWIGLVEAVERLEATLASVESMEHLRGHLLNWYDTRTLAPLSPRYVSTVDNGNLAGHLIAVANSCREWIERPDEHATPARGLADTAAVLRATLVAADSIPEADRRHLVDHLDVLLDALDAHDGRDRAAFGELAAGAREIAGRAEQLALTAGESAPDVAVWAEALRRAVDSHQRDATLSASDRARLNARLARLEHIAHRETMEMDFTFLYDHRRSLLSVGYQVEEERLDDSSYDLLASEARLASYVAIAKGDVRTRHWFLLGRPVVAVGAGAALMSWAGSMFEYLMPPLVLRAPSGGLLDRTAHLVVRRQIEYGEELGVPWGVSESAYNVRDLNFTYQYSQFGVPGLGAVRGLAENVVIAPYATGLAAMVSPGPAAENYARLTQLGARGRYGYYEAVDFTASRLRTGETHAVVRCYMAHHQGMTIVAIHNAAHEGLMRDRFHSEPMVRAAALLLQERAPRDVPITHARKEERATPQAVRTFAPPVERRFTGAGVLAPTTHHLSNGTLSLTLTPAGGGHLRWRTASVNRWEPDATSDPGADRVYLREPSTGDLWTATPMPRLDPADTVEVRFSEERAEYVRRHGQLTTELDYHVSPESDAVVRRLTIRNHDRHARSVTVTSYNELVLGQAADDRAHPAFSKMFVRTELLAELDAVIATRRRRSPDEPEMWAGHFVTVEHGQVGPAGVETDRARFLGRLGTPAQPEMLVSPEGRPSGTTGDVLDPVFSLTQRLHVPAGGMARLYLWTVVAETRDELVELIDRHRGVGAFERVVMLAWTQSQVQLRHLGISADDASQFQKLAGHVTFPHPALRPAPATLRQHAGPQSALWPLGISGDLPIVLVRIDEPDDVDIVRQLVQAFEYWRLKRFAVDLVVLNDRMSSYVQGLQGGLEALVSSVRSPGGQDGAGGHIYVVRADQIAPDALRVLPVTARAVLLARRGDLTAHLRRAPDVDPSRQLPPLPPSRPPVELEPFDPGDLQLFNGHGGFGPDGTEYVTVLDAGRPTPAPWINVVANEQFGFHAAADGAGYTWWANSRDNQLTPWRNDPVGSPLSEAFYVRNQGTGALCSPTAQPIDDGRHVTRHGFGFTEYVHDRPDLGLHLRLVQTVGGDDAVKISQLWVTNTGPWPGTFAVTWYAEVVLGLGRHQTALHLTTERDVDTGALLVRNPWSTQFDQVVFADLAGQQESWTGDRSEFLGPHGDWAAPTAVISGEPLSGHLGAALDPAVALQQTFTLQPGETGGVAVLFGAAPDVHAARRLIGRYRTTPTWDVLADVQQRWRDRLGRIRVRTPDPAFDVMMNGWLLYQTLSCRMLARCGYYQTSGAYGFRDQLQDSMAAVLVDPERAREHLIRAAERQFVDGDVQHWWLPASGMGVRTRISDDVVWLAHAAARYVRVTGDEAVLDERVMYLEGQRLGDDEHEAFFAPMVSERTATLYDHCVLALVQAFRTGDHGLPLMGTGDWNDGMNRVGADGRGESVWLGWFLHQTLSDFAVLAARRGDRSFAARCRAVQSSLLRNLEAHGWDGAWYRRGFFDDGTPLGSAGSTECRIDAIAQSWAVLSGVAVPVRAATAMHEVSQQLVMAHDGVVRLFTPPFQVAEPDPGYIRAYPPGVRENGGQYTHGATWSVFAYAALGRQDRAHALFSMLNPANHAKTPEAVARYRVEPYVVAADVYSVAPHVGRGGWTWYTGASGWLYRAGLEAIVGVRPEGAGLVIEPCLPPDWTWVELDVMIGPGGHHVVIEGEPGPDRRVVHIEVDGEALLPGQPIPPPVDGAVRSVRVVLGTPERSPAATSEPVASDAL